MEDDDKKSESISVKMSDELKTFVLARFKQESMKSPGDYIRRLIEADRAIAKRNYSLLAEALGINVIRDDVDFFCQTKKEV